jgi:hypothetical protein
MGVSARMIGRSMSVLGDAPPRLAPLPRDFFAGLSALLDVLAPPLLDHGMTKATPREDGVEVVLAHATEIASSIWAQASADGVLVGCAALHEECPDAPAALVTVAALLCGERDVPGYDGSLRRPDFGARTA